ncbi:MAG TPA: DUF1802 family protein [Gemmataceae bacterium]|jgi:hypothetical protein
MALSIAFKEWAAICRALGEGRQALILRKGGIAEVGGEFRPEHDRFLLYPSYFHEQHHTGIKPELMPLLEAAEQYKPAAGRIHFAYFADVSAIWHFESIDKALSLDSFHGWTADEVTKRFHYRTPGLYAMAVRVYRLKAPVEISERPEYAGCKTWVNLDAAINDADARPVLADAAFDKVLGQLKAAISGQS